LRQYDWILFAARATRACATGWEELSVGWLASSWLIGWIDALTSGWVADSNACVAFVAFSKGVLAPKTIQKSQRGFRYIVSGRSGDILLFETVHTAIWSNK
jgi:hypothetical protein